MVESLKSKTINALVWNLVDKFGQQLLFFASGIILARLLDSRDFGLLGMITIFTTISTILIDSGFGMSLIKKRQPTQADYNSVFYFNLVVSIMLYLILYFLAPFIADFYREPDLTLLCRITFLGIILNAISLIQNIQLLRAINFKVSGIANIISLSISGGVSVLMAFKGFGVWSLVAQTLLNFFFRTVIIWFLGSWRPTFEVKGSSIKEMLPFGIRTIGASLLNGVYNNIYPMIIGRFFSVSDVGYYFQANKLQNIPIGLIDNTFRGVTLSVIASVNDDIARMKRVLSKNIRTIGFLTFPLMSILIVFAKPLVIKLLTDKWFFSIEYIQILSLSGAISPFITIFNDLCNINHRSDLYLKLEIYKKIFLTLLIVFSIPFGVKAMVWAWVVYSILSLLISIKIAGFLIQYSLRDFLKDIYLPMTLSIAIGLVSAVLLNFNENLLFQLVFGISIFVLLYVIVLLLLKNETAREFFSLFFKFMNRLR